jgi:MFS family permease
MADDWPSAQTRIGDTTPAETVGAPPPFKLLFLVMLTIAAGNTALQSVLPAIGRSLGVPDAAVAAAFSVSALVWVISAPLWAQRSDRRGRRGMVLLGLFGFCSSVLLCGVFLAAGINGWIAPLPAFLCFIVARMLYGIFGAAAPPASQAIVAAGTTRGERTRALSLLGSAFGLGTILGPAFAPLFVLPGVGLAGPAFVYSIFGIGVLIVAAKLLPEDALGDARGAATSYPSIGGEPTGASARAATADDRGKLPIRDPRIWPWMLMVGAGAALLAQWGLIPNLKLAPRELAIWGSVLAAAGCVLTGFAHSLHMLAVSYGLASLGFGFLRPAFTAGASLAVGMGEQGAVAGKTTSINGACFVLGPSIGVGLYQIWEALPYLIAGVSLLLMLPYVLLRLKR